MCIVAKSIKEANKNPHEWIMYNDEYLHNTPGTFMLYNDTNTKI